jgi:hypothetical protein
MKQKGRQYMPLSSLYDLDVYDRRRRDRKKFSPGSIFGSGDVSALNSLGRLTSLARLAEKFGKLLVKADPEARGRLIGSGMSFVAASFWVRPFTRSSSATAWNRRRF